MPKRRTTRDRFKRKFDQLDHQYDLMIAIYSEMFQVYHADHPDITLQLALMLETLTELQTATKRFRNSF